MSSLSIFTGQKQESNFEKYKSDYWVVTSCTPQYLPGLIALRNSLEIFFPEAKLACFYYDQGTKYKLPDRVEYIFNAPMLGPVVDANGAFRHGLKLGPDMYSRLLIPKYFSGKAFYVDVDCIVINSLKEAWDLDLEGHPTACVWREDIGWVGGNIHDSMASGTYLCDTDRWEELLLVEKVFEVMKNYVEGNIKRTFKVNVESALSFVHEENYKKLHRAYQNLAYYYSLCRKDKIIHWGGPKPWDIQNHRSTRPTRDWRANYVNLWEAVYDYDVENTNRLLDKLPKEFPPKQQVGSHQAKIHGKNL